MSTTPLATPAYRADVDGLRAIAILLVLLFHCGFSAFSGGFVGVDVFFVISGYLITSIILNDLRRGTFTFTGFYARRIRRLLPALLVTVLLTLVAAVFIMTPEHLVGTAASGWLAIVSVSNFYFAKVASYFDGSAHQKPFLHMWSLSVEEQFYLFWPAGLMLLHRWRLSRFVGPIVCLGIPAGLALSHYWIAKNPNHAYFLLPFRAFQFLMGAACIWINPVKIRNAILGHCIGLGGLLLILAPAVGYSDGTPFPGIAAAVPSLGAVLVIWQGRQLALQRALGNRIMVWFGRISYSTYLVHWPITVLAVYLAIEPLAWTDKVLLLVASVVGGQLLDSLVTQRFRYAETDMRRKWLFPATQSALLLVISALCVLLIRTAGLPDRYAFAPEISKYRNESLFPFLRDYRDGELRIGAGNVAPRVLVFGDSMAQNYVPAILQIEGMESAGVDVITRGGCVLARNAVLINHGSPDRMCLSLRDRLFSLQAHYDVVIWSQNWLGYGKSLHWEMPGSSPVAAFRGDADIGGWRDGIIATLRHFGQQSGRMIVIGPPVTVEVNPIVERIGPLTDISAVAKSLQSSRETGAPKRQTLDDALRTLLAEQPNVTYVDPRAIICGGGHCQLSQRGLSYYMDSIHNTSAAIPLLRQGLASSGVRL